MIDSQQALRNRRAELRDQIVAFEDSITLIQSEIAGIRAVLADLDSACPESAAETLRIGPRIRVERIRPKTVENCERAVSY